ncbi:MAG: OmpH family outer membrane protein [Candidatus Sericytochromatia bacterium]|nr:OmpH family outer membrane protein [Candidatus Sericytochromatia bacterium]
MSLSRLLTRATLGAALGAGLLATTAAPAAAMAVGYVDTAKVLLSYKGARSAQGKMQAELLKYQQAFTERQRKIAEAQQAGKSQAEIQKMTEAFEKELQPLKAKAMNLEAQLSGDVKKKIEGVIHTVARRRSLDLVLDKAAVLHGGTDITQDVVKALQGK